MEKQKNSSKKVIIIKMIKFTLFSLSAGIIQFGSFAVLHGLLYVTEWVAHLIALILSVVWNFTLNRKFTFKSANNVPLAMLKVAMFYVVFTPVSTYLMDLLVGAQMDGMIAELLIMLLNFVLEFLYSNFFVFNPKLDIKKYISPKRRVILLKRNKK